MPKVVKPRRHGNRWRISYQDADGKRRLETFATQKEAKAALHRRNAESEAIRTGAAPRPPEPHAFGELCDYWLEHRTPLKRNQKDDRSIIRRHLRPAFAALLVSEVSVQRVDRYVKSKRDLSKKTVSNHLTLLVSMLNLAVELEWLASAPRIRKPKTVEHDYRWLRSAEECGALLDAAREETEGVMELYATAIYTGMRAGELLGLRWDDIDFERRLITVRRSYEKPTKSARIRHVPILDPLVPVLRAWRLRCPSEVVFPGETGRPQSASARVLQEKLKRSLTRAGLLKSKEHSDAPHARLTFHDLRHTFASHWVMHGGDLFRLQKILGHASTQMTQRYAHLAPEAFASDWGRLGDMVPKDGEVVAFGGKGQR